MKLVSILCLTILVLWAPADLFGKRAEPPTELSLKAPDGLVVTADQYLKLPKKAPWILLCHQAGFSRGEYAAIAPKLNALGFNCLALDQRSGSRAVGIVNKTAERAQAAGLKATFLDASQDIEAGIDHLKTDDPEAKIILWGSSYSASLVLTLAAKRPKDIAAVLAFAPGEYFGRFGKGQTWVQEEAKKIKAPVFITGAKSEKEMVSSIFKALPGAAHTLFIPKTEGRHGSKALWQDSPDHKAYWTAVKIFLSTAVLDVDKKESAPDANN